MILYIGEKHHAFILNDICNRNETLKDGYEVITSLNIMDILSPATAKPYQHIVIDVTIFANDAADITRTLLKIQKTINANIIIEAPGTLPKASIIVSLYNAGFKNFVCSTYLAEKKEELAKCMTGYYDVNPIPFEDEIVSISTDELEETSDTVISIDSIRQAQKQKTEIGVVGCSHRIGTTTQALQIVKYLTLKGYNACYIEANQSGWILNYMQNRTEDEYRYSEQVGLINYKEMDLYINRQHIPLIKKKDYDFFVYDYGCYQDTSFEKMSFNEKNIGIVVGGIKPTELEAIDEVLEDTFSRNNIYYIFSFIDTDTEDKKDILDLMDERASQTFFAPPAGNPFFYSSTRDSAYNDIFDIQKKKNKATGKKNKWFQRKKG